MTDALRIEGVSHSYGRVQAVKSLNLTLAKGSFVGLIGHNGAGKSTTLKLVTGLLKPSAGRIWIDGIDVVAEPLEARRRYGAVPEEPALFEALSAQEFLEFVAEVRGKGQVSEGLAIADLGADAQRPIREYSQGMRRRTALAAALLGEPPLLVLDEALNGLDPPAAAAVKRHLRGCVERGQTVLLSTHVVETVQAVADRVVMMARGEIVADEETRNLPAGGLESMFLERMEASKQAP